MSKASDVVLRLLLVTGNRSDFTFTAENTVFQVKQQVLLNWPREWMGEERAESVDRMRLLYRGRFLEDDLTLESKPDPHDGVVTVLGLNLPKEQFISMHLLLRPPRAVDFDTKQGTQPSGRCCGLCRLIKGPRVVFLMNAAGVDAFAPKDAALFKSVLKYYDFKQYKRGLKVVEQLLKKYPDHAELLAMRGLFLSNFSKNEEAYASVRLGLRKNIKSHVCWHAYGILYRSDRNYEEALKCYRHALKYDKNNTQILRELAVLQTQSRDYAGLCETRYALLSQKPSLRVHWHSLSLAYFLAGKFEESVKILDAYLEGMPTVGLPAAQEGEMSELLFFRAMALEKNGNLVKALETLDGMSKRRDPVEWARRKGSLLLRLGRPSEAKRVVAPEFAINPDDADLLKLLLLAEEGTSISTTLNQLIQEHPGSLILRIETLRHCPVRQLLENLELYILPLITKGAPSVFNLISFLYANAEALPIMDQFVAKLGDDTWSRLFLGQHYCKIGRFDDALSVFEKLAEKSPAIPEVFLYYARALKRMGLLEKAAECMIYAKGLDGSDRFINSKCVKYLLRAGRIVEAQRIAVLFLKKGEFAAQLQDLVELQSIWYAYEMGLALQARGAHIKALAYFGQIMKHFDDFVDDQYDFHNYILRRSCFSQYARMLEFEDHIYGHPYWKKAATAAVNSLLALKADGGLSANLSGLTLGEEPVSCQWIQTEEARLRGIKDVIEEARRWIMRLEQFCAKDEATFKVSFEFYIQEGSLLKAVRALYHLSKVAPQEAAPRKSIVIKADEIIASACNRALAEIPDCAAIRCDPKPALPRVSGDLHVLQSLLIK